MIPKLTIHQTKSGSFTLKLERPGRETWIWRTGIPTYEEALSRAKTVHDLCGYRVDKKVRA